MNWFKKIFGSHYAFNSQSSLQSFDLNSEKCELSDDDEEEPWRHSFKLQSTQKSTQLKEFKSSQQEAEAESTSSQTDKSDDKMKVKVGKYKKFKYM